MPKIAVIGLGRFGMSLARQLGASGAQVIAIDRRMELVNELRDVVDVAVRLDSTDRSALESQDIGSIDVCVVSIGENFEASLMTTVLVRELGVPRIICRAQSRIHAEIFRQIGVAEVIQPEIQAGEQLGSELANDHIDRFLRLEEGLSLVEIRAPKQFHGKSLRFLKLREKFDVNLVLLRQRIASGAEAEEKVHVPSADDVINAEDHLLLVGTMEALAKLPQE